jgi:hypothetical protein
VFTSLAIWDEYQKYMDGITSQYIDRSLNPCEGTTDDHIVNYADKEINQLTGECTEYYTTKYYEKDRS